MVPRKSWMLLSVVLLALLTWGLVPGAGEAQEKQAPVTVFTAEHPEGKVWVNVDLTRQRTDQNFVPIVVAVQNMGSRPIVLSRSSFKLMGSSGGAVSMASIEEIRKEYPRLNFDARTVKAQGMPFGTRLSRQYFVASNFFPTMAAGGSIKRDEVTLPPSYWMVDLFYFRRPEGLSEGKRMILQVFPDGWEEPLEVHFNL